MNYRDELLREMARIRKWQGWAQRHPYDPEAARYGDMACDQLASLQLELDRTK